MLIGQSVDPEREQEMRRFIEAREEVGRVISVITLQLGNEVMVAVQAEMRENQSAQQLTEEINRVERAFKAQFTEVRWSFFEPDLKPQLSR